MFDVGAPSVYMCLFCASCWFEHQKHQHPSRRRVIPDCEVCNVIGAHRTIEEAHAFQALRAAERRLMVAFGWRQNGDTWDPPPDQNFKYQSGYNHNHAVNALKQRQGEASQRRQPRNPRWQRPDDDD